MPAQADHRLLAERALRMSTNDSGQYTEGQMERLIARAHVHAIFALTDAIREIGHPASREQLQDLRDLGIPGEDLTAPDATRTDMPAVARPYVPAPTGPMPIYDLVAAAHRRADRS